METEAKNIIEKQINKLPVEIRDVLASDELHQKIVTIGEKNHLHIDQIGILEDEVVLLMTGLSDPGNFAAELSKQITIAPQQLDEVIGDVTQAIFLPIRESMKKVYESLDSADSEKSVVMPSAVNTSTVSPVAPKPAAPVSIPPTLVTPSAPVSAPAPKVAPVPPATPVTLKVPMIEAHAADMMLSQPTVSLAPKPISPASPAQSPASSPTNTQAPSTPKIETAGTTQGTAAKPAPYKVDPYREPPE